MVTDILFFFLFINDTATTEIYTYLHTLSLHDALPIVRVSAEAVALPKRWTAFPVRSGPPQLVGIAAFRDRVSVDVLVGSVRFRPAGDRKSTRLNSSH